MNHISTCCCLISVVLLFSCKEKPVSAPVQNPAANVATQPPPGALPVPFVPPADSTIALSQMNAWSACNPLLDSLTFRYADSFRTTDPTAMIRYQEDFISGQDRICIKTGLAGGYKEYKWILQNMGTAKNRTILQSANAQPF